MTQETWLLTGGAGYIGSHIADEFIRAGKSVVIYDSLYQGLESRIQYLRTKHNTDIPLIKADIRDYNEIEGVIRKYNINGIVHTAALKAVGESMDKPDEYFEVNLTATNELIDIARRNYVKKCIFSSTAAVYGSPDSMEPCLEDGPKAPISPYGDSKYQAEAKVTAFISTLEAMTLERGLELLAGRRAWEAENGPSPKKSRKKAAKAKPGDSAPSLTKNTVKKAASKKKAAKKATGKSKSSAE